MARDRKRARDRRARRSRPEDEHGLLPQENDETPEAGDPLHHLSADADLAAAQLAVGRPELGDGETAEDEAPAGESAPDELQDVPVAGRESRRQRRLAQLQQREPHQEGDPVALDAPAPAETERAHQSGNRVIAFLGASWRELQRVQWPDRQQVAQATGVVLVFVVIAGLYLGLTGALASRLVKALLS